MCEDATRAEVRLRLHRTIQQYGWGIQCVEARPGETPWAYTIGLTAAVGHPELVVLGLEPLQSVAVIDVLAEWVLAGERCQPGPQGIDVAGLHVHLVEVHPIHLQAGLLASWVDYYAAFGPPPPRFEALQILPTLLLRPNAAEVQLRLDRPETSLGISRPNRAQRRAARHRR